LKKLNLLKEGTSNQSETISSTQCTNTVEEEVDLFTERKANTTRTSKSFKENMKDLDTKEREWRKEMKKIYLKKTTIKKNIIKKIITKKVITKKVLMENQVVGSPVL